MKRDDTYVGRISLTDTQLSALSIVVSGCVWKGASELPFAISDDELKDASAAVSRLNEDLGGRT